MSLPSSDQRPATGAPAASASKNTRVIVLEDDLEIRALLQRYLTAQGLTVRIVANREQLLRLLAREPFDILVLDLMLGTEDGLSICRELRAKGEELAIIMLTAKGDPVDRIIGLEMGADDYMPKPFDPRELIARINAQMRKRTAAPLLSKARDEPIRFGAFALLRGARRLDRDGVVIELTHAEFELLLALITHAGQPMGRERLREIVGTRGREAVSRSLDVQILRLRRAIEPDPAKPIYIKTVWGTGYMFAAGHIVE